MISLFLRKRFTEKGSVIIEMTIENTNEHKKVEDELRLHSQILSNLAEGVYLVRTADLTIAYTNPKIEEMFGYEPGEMLGQHVGIINAPSDIDQEEVARHIESQLKAKGNWNGDVLNRKKDGTLFWCHVNISAFDHPQFGKVWLSIQEDINTRKSAENALIESEQRFRALFENAPIAYQSLDESWRYIDANEELQKLLGYRVAELEGKTFREFWTEKTQPLFPDIFCQFKKQGTVDAELHLLRKNGTSITVLLNGRIQSNNTGKFVCAHCILHDITERKRIENDLVAAKKAALKAQNEAESLVAQPAIPVAGISEAKEVSYKIAFRKLFC